MRATFNPRAAFTLLILALALLYTYGAFAELNFLSVVGRLGPGFFPRIIGLLLIAACLYSLYADLRQAHAEEEGSPHWRTVVAIAALSAAFVALLDVLGGLAAMIAFMFAALSLLNRGRHLQNALIAALLPGCLYLLFEVWLNAAMPDGIVPFLP